MALGNQTVEEILCRLCKKQCGREVSVEEELLKSGKLKSFQLLDLICDIEEKFGILLDPEDIMEIHNFDSVNAIIHMLEERYFIEK